MLGEGGCWDGDKAATIATQPLESTGSGPPGQMECSQLHTDCQGCLATAINTGYSVENKCTLHTCPGGLATLPIRYEVHPQGRKCVHNITYCQ